MTESLGQRLALLILFGAVLFYGAHGLYQDRRFTATARETTGVVTGTDGSRFIIHYQVDGQTYVIEESRPRRGTPTGDVPVIYDPSAPQNAKWKNGRNWFFPAILALLATIGCLRALFPRPFAKLQRPFGT